MKAYSTVVDVSLVTNALSMIGVLVTMVKAAVVDGIHVILKKPSVFLSVRVTMALPPPLTMHMSTLIFV